MSANPPGRIACTDANRDSAAVLPTIADPCNRVARAYAYRDVDARMIERRVGNVIRSHAHRGGANGELKELLHSIGASNG